MIYVGWEYGGYEQTCMQYGTPSRLSCGLVDTPKSIRNERRVIVIRSCGSVVIYTFNETGRNYSTSRLPFQLFVRNTHLPRA